MADYHSLLMRAVANLTNAGTPETRGAIYGRARKALLEQLRSLRPPLPESDVAREEKALDEAIAKIEAKYGSEGAAGPARRPRRRHLAGRGKAWRRAWSHVHAASSRLRPAPGRARGVQAVRGPGATACPDKAKSTRTHAERADTAWVCTAASVDGSGARPAGRAAPVPASADHACGQGRRSRVGGRGFAGSIAADGCDGQFALGPGRSCGRGERRQG